MEDREQGVTRRGSSASQCQLGQALDPLEAVQQEYVPYKVRAVSQLRVIRPAALSCHPDRSSGWPRCRQRCRINVKLCVKTLGSWANTSARQLLERPNTSPDQVLVCPNTFIARPNTSPHAFHRPLTLETAQITRIYTENLKLC